jgi:hypothetical protein
MTDLLRDLWAADDPRLDELADVAVASGLGAVFAAIDDVLIFALADWRREQYEQLVRLPRARTMQRHDGRVVSMYAVPLYPLSRTTNEGENA